MFFLSRAIYCAVHVLLKRNIKDNLSFCVQLGLTCAHRSYMYMSDNLCTFHAVTTQKCYLKFIVVIICITHYHRHICVQKTRQGLRNVLLQHGSVKEVGAMPSTQECC
jgi:hypothetical protein